MHTIEIHMHTLPHKHMHTLTDFGCEGKHSRQSTKLSCFCPTDPLNMGELLFVCVRVCVCCHLSVRVCLPIAVSISKRKQNVVNRA